MTTATPSGDVGQGTLSGGGVRPPRGLLIDLSGVDLGARRHSRADLERWNPHRGPMALLDWVVWYTEDLTLGIGLKQVREDEFWVQGHFPNRPMMPGVLMVETAAQMASFLYNARFTTSKLVAFIRIENASFRSSVLPGDDLYILCREVRRSSKRFIFDIQGVVDGRIAFESRISGVVIGDAP